LKVLITGGSGFIGTNLIETFKSQGVELLSVDIHKPRVQSHEKTYREIDIRIPEQIDQVIQEFQPTHIVHLAARADLNEKKDISGYSANTEGVRHLIRAISNASSVKRCLFTSTKLIVPNASGPQNDLDFRPDTLYGQSKSRGEQIVRESDELKCEWCILRPTSIWGPWSDAPYNPYGRFFKMVAKGRYFHPGNIDPPRYFGYVGNVVFQIIKLLSAPADKIQGKVFYLADYETYHIKEWADLISRKSNGHGVKNVPMSLIWFAAKMGDLLKVIGLKNPPITSFRLKNMQTDTTHIPLDAIKHLTGPLPFTIDNGVEETIAWMRKQNLIKK
jgi:nucleoside-diphosphate-sugar epimerase